jgi:hypothetical protein
MGQIYATAEKTLIDLRDDSLQDQKGLALLKCLIKEKKTWKPLEMGEALVSPSTCGAFDPCSGPRFGSSTIRPG